MVDSEEKEREQEMTAAIKRVRDYKLPSSVLRQLGLDDKWNEKVSEELIESIADTIRKYRRVVEVLAEK